jgi:hypothetical protein
MHNAHLLTCVHAIVVSKKMLAIARNVFLFVIQNALMGIARHQMFALVIEVTAKVSQIATTVYRFAIQNVRMDGVLPLISAHAMLDSQRILKIIRIAYQHVILSV